MDRAEIHDFLMGHHNYAERYPYISSLDKNPDKSLAKIQEVLDLDLGIREARESKTDCAALESKRLTLLSGLDRDELTYLCDAYHAVEGEEPLEEYEFYLHRLAMTDLRLLTSVKIEFTQKTGTALDIAIKLRERQLVSLEINGTVIDITETDPDLIVRELELCNFAAWAPEYGSADDSGVVGDVEWSVRTKYVIDSMPDGHRKLKIFRSDGYGPLEGYSFSYPLEWHHLMKLLRYLHSLPNGIVKLPDVTGIEGAGWEELEAAQRIAFHSAFACAIPHGAALPQKDDVTIVPLTAQESARKPNPDLVLFNDSELNPFFKGKILFSQTKLDREATGFAVFRGKTLCFIFLCGTHEDAERILHKIPTPEVRFHAGIVDADSAMQKIAMVLAGTALFNYKQDDPPYAYFGHQPGVFTKSEAFLTKDLKLDYMYLLCNSDEFMPRFVQTSY